MNEEELKSFINGSADDSQIERVAGSLEQQPQIAELLDKLLKENPNQLEQHLRHWSRDYAQENTCNLGVEKAKRNWLAQDIAQRLPEKLGRFSDLRPCKIRRLSTLCRAIDSETDEVVALKLQLTPFLTQNECDRFAREGQLLASASHPNVVRCIDVGYSSGFSYLAMEWLQGADLSEVLRATRTLPPAMACELIAQAAEGLSELHRAGVIHRDIKPSNIFLTFDGVVKLLDLGVSQLNKAARVTLSADVLGTMDYMAPEQAFNAADADERSDIYSLGCTLFCLLSGRPPFFSAAHGNLLRTAMAHATLDFPKIEMFRNDLQKGVSQILEQMVAREPDQRFDNVSRIVEALSEYRDIDALEQFSADMRTSPQSDEFEFALTKAEHETTSAMQAHEATAMLAPEFSQKHHPAPDPSLVSRRTRRWVIPVLVSVCALFMLAPWAWLATIQSLSPKASNQAGDANENFVDFSNAQLSAPRDWERAPFKKHIVYEGLLKPRRARVVDLDGDGDQDILIGSHTKVGYFENDGSENFVFRKVGQTILTTSVSAVDFDKDGDLDIVATTYGDETQPTVGNHLLIYVNNGLEGYDWQVVTKAALGPCQAIPSDLDRDGDTDFLLASSKDHTFAWYENQGGFEFQQQIVHRGRYARSICTADFDADGAPDIVTAAKSEAQVSIHYGMASASEPLAFETSGLPRAVDPYYVLVVDLDSDRDQDILVGTAKGNELYWYENLPNRQWQRQLVADSLSGCQHFSPGDMDGDGDIDLVAANTDASQLILLTNDGEQDFTPSVISSNCPKALCAAVGDLDSDGDLDVIGLSWAKDQVYWYENQSSPEIVP